MSASTSAAPGAQHAHAQPVMYHVGAVLHVELRRHAADVDLLLALLGSQPQQHAEPAVGVHEARSAAHGREGGKLQQALEEARRSSTLQSPDPGATTAAFVGDVLRPVPAAGAAAFSPRSSWPTPRGPRRPAGGDHFHRGQSAKRRCASRGNASFFERLASLAMIITSLLAAVDVFGSGADGYNCYRIPSMIMLPGGRIFGSLRRAVSTTATTGRITPISCSSRRTTVVDGGVTWNVSSTPASRNEARRKSRSRRTARSSTTAAVGRVRDDPVARVRAAGEA